MPRKKMNLRCHFCKEKPRFIKCEEETILTNLQGRWKVIGYCPRCGYPHKELIEHEIEQAIGE